MMKQVKTNSVVKLSDIDHMLPLNNEWEVRATVNGLMLFLCADTQERKEAVNAMLEQLKQSPGMNEEIWDACYLKALELIHLATPKDIAAPALPAPAPEPAMPVLTGHQVLKNILTNHDFDVDGMNRDQRNIYFEIYGRAEYAQLCCGEDAAMNTWEYWFEQEDWDANMKKLNQAATKKPANKRAKVTE